MPESSITCVKTQASAASKRGVQYEVANGTTIPNMGEKELYCISDGEGHRRKITAQICAVSQPLMSVYKLVKAGNTVVFSPEGSFIQDGSTLDKIWLREEGGMFMSKMWVPTKPADAGF